MDVWDPIMLGKLSSNHTIILLDNRGMGMISRKSQNSVLPVLAN